MVAGSDVVGANLSEQVALDLLELRTQMGEPSYNEIRLRVIANRMEAGADRAAAEVARSSIYDLFRTGRKRTNTALLREVVFALTGDSALTEQWLAQYDRLVAANDNMAAQTVTPPDTSSATPAENDFQHLKRGGCRSIRIFRSSSLSARITTRLPAPCRLRITVRVSRPAFPAQTARTGAA